MSRRISKNLLREIMQEYDCSMTEAIEIHKCEKLDDIESCLSEIYGVLFSVTCACSHTGTYLNISGSVDTYEK